MMEHRLIERMIGVIRKELNRIRDLKQIDPVFIDTAVDFIRMYADRTHHGKEEGILFRDLEYKQMADDHKSIMNDLIQEHQFARTVTAELVTANQRYRQGDNPAIETIIEKLQTLIAFYPKHIEKEDSVFFPAAMNYFSEDEQAAMLDVFWDFDKHLIHEKYTDIVELLELTH